MQIFNQLIYWKNYYLVSADLLYVVDLMFAIFKEYIKIRYFQVAEIGNFEND